MKKTIFSLILFTAIATTASAQTTGLIADVLRKSMEQKVASMQELIQFDDVKAEQLFKVECAYLFEVRKVEGCRFCNKKKRLEKLQENRDKNLQIILDRDQYIKYKMIEDDLLQKRPLWAE
ncbi:MAG TPA: hypothetical protein GXZ56_01365 [Bacteroidales bacterium]|jgi:hypothetical protein|nr:hypothetical protein [Bacteroidales bacterium]